MALPSPPQICVIGDVAWDVLIRTDTELRKGGDTFGLVELQPGGSGANVAVWASRSGADVTFIGKVGRDRMGRLAADDLHTEGVVAFLPDTRDILTGSVAVFVDHTGERSMVSGQGADFDLRTDELPYEALGAADHLHLTAWSFFTDPPRTAARRAAELASAAGSTLSFDPGSFQMIDEMGPAEFLRVTSDIGVDVFLPNREEGAVLTGLDDPGDIAAKLHEMYNGALVVLKLDADGALIHNGESSFHVDSVPAEMSDATGAGDSFAGAFLASYLFDGDARSAAVFATHISAWVIGRAGARPAVDESVRDIVQRFIPY
ncbi:MAG TPA: carbohydrate kinase family protein [Ilumatobacter sp.]|nr:carbohydrate kinase family protein [Ilumatobacter sp.]